ncbi:MAG: phosphoribosylamine--glycine ligase, partial [Bacteroidales bacterium]
MRPVKALVLGGGGREHALAWRLALDRAISEVYCAPGNAGTAQVATNLALDPANPADVVSFIESHGVALTVVGPELPLTRGVVDEIVARNA